MIHFQHTLPELAVVMCSVRFERLTMLTKSHRFHVAASLLLYRKQPCQLLPQPNVLVLFSFSRTSLSCPSYIHDIRRRVSRHCYGKHVTQHEHTEKHVHDDILEPESIPLSLSLRTIDLLARILVQPRRMNRHKQKVQIEKRRGQTCYVPVCRV